jgi:polar amino acid transport system permease protein
MDRVESLSEPKSRSHLGTALLVVLALAGGWAAFQHLSGGSSGVGVAGYDWDFGVLWKYRGLLVSGLLYTLLFTVICVVLGLIVKSKV